MGSTDSSLKTKFHVPESQSSQPGSSQVIDVEKSETEKSLGGGLSLRFVDREFFEDLKTKGEEMKRSAGPSDKAFIDDLLNSRLIEPELGAAIIQQHIQRVVDARKSFYEQLQAAQESTRAAQAEVMEASNSPHQESQAVLFPEESDVQQWLTESTTSDNILQTSSDVKESPPPVQSKTIPSS